MKKIFKKILKMTLWVAIVFLIFGLVAFGVDHWVEYKGSKYILDVKNLPQSDAVIVLGAYVLPGGTVSDMLKDRLDNGLEAYYTSKTPKIIVSGDHGRTSYDEVNSMRNYLQEKGVQRENIFMDHAGFDTYDSLYRARDVFKVKKAIIVTQRYHLVRALYIARKLGIEAYGVAADVNVYAGMKYYRFREYGARGKAFLQAAVFKPYPKYLGKAIPIWESGVLTDDGKS